MKHLLLVAAVLISMCAFAQKPGTANEGDLEPVLSKMDQASAGFKSAQASFQWDQYQQMVNETDVQKGTVHFRRNNKGIDAAFDITSPAPKVILFTSKDGKLRIYEPRIDQVTERDVTKNKSDVEAIMSLGFGGRGHDLPRSYQVKMNGWETVDNVKTAKLELIPKDNKFRNVVSRILLWIDPERDISLKQQFFEPSGDYRLAHYTGIKLNEKIPDNAFRLKTSSKTKVVTP
ncbi:MAG: outer membrane lipoprotein-sorting protein [Candidatus Angelobacter sp. Gp1-AA117]|nr:MAG: outer membrane lipoprotein-sorting protein [Candidatus Angelobacter sp. Gp1-AA117]